MKDIFNKYDGDIDNQLDHFPKYIEQNEMARFLARYEIYKQVKEIKGSIVECGVQYGSGIMTWAKLVNLFEPYSIHRKMIGFDTFDGFPEISEKDKTEMSLKHNSELKKNGLKISENSLDELIEIAHHYDNERPLNSFPNIELIKGNAVDTIPDYVERNSHLVIALLFLDFDIYKPTKIALEYLLPRVPKGGIVVFDELNNQFWPGETTACIEHFGSLNKLNLKKLPFECNMSYMVVE